MNNTFQTTGPLGSTSKIQFQWTFGKHVQIQIHQTSEKHVQTSNHWTSEKHVQISNHQTSGKHVQNFKSIGSLGNMSKIQDYDWNPHFFVTTSMHILYSFFFFPKKKKKKKLHAWTTFRPNPSTKRYVGNLPQDSINILIHNMTICIFIYMHHTFTTVKYWLQPAFYNSHLTSHGG